MTELNGIRVLVTGATSGLGAAMAAALAEAGARVMVTGRERARAEEAAKGLGSSAIASELDVRDERSVAAYIARARDAWGGIDMLVNNAGIGMRTVNPSFMARHLRSWPTGQSIAQVKTSYEPTPCYRKSISTANVTGSAHYQKYNRDS